MNTEAIITGTTGVHLMDTTPGILIRKSGGSFFVCHHFGGGETAVHARYRTERGARNFAALIAKQSATPYATCLQ